MISEVPDEWKSHLEQIISSPGVVIVVGDIDTGKTFLCSHLANYGLNSGIDTAVVDGDMGQSEIGPPTTVGLGIMESTINTIGDLKPYALRFIGSTSPYGHLLSSVVSIKLLVEKAQAMKKQLIIVDTTGLIYGLTARKLKTHKIELLSPKHIVAIQRSSEAEHFLHFFDVWEDCTIHRLTPSSSARSKTQTLRTQRRAVRLREYFISGHVHQLQLGNISTSGAWLKSGRILEPKILKFAESSLKSQVLHGESIDRGIYLVTSGNYNKRGVLELQDHFRTKNIVIAQADKYINLVVGLLDSHLELLSLGIIREIDFRAETIDLLTPLRSISPVRAIQFGIIKIRPNGTQLAQLRPGEI